MNTENSIGIKRVSSAKNAPDYLMISKCDHLYKSSRRRRSSIYQSIQESDVRPSIQKLKLGPNWLKQEEIESKYTSKFTRDWLKKNRIKVPRPG